MPQYVLCFMFQVFISNIFAVLVFRSFCDQQVSSEQTSTIRIWYWWKIYRLGPYWNVGHNVSLFLLTGFIALPRTTHSHRVVSAATSIFFVMYLSYLFKLSINSDRNAGHYMSHYFCTPDLVYTSSSTFFVFSFFCLIAAVWLNPINFY